MRFLKRIDSIILITLSLSSIFVVIIDYYNLFDNIELFKTIEYVPILFILISFIALHLGVSHLSTTNFQDKFSGGAEEINSGFEMYAESIINSVHGVKLTTFQDAGEQELYLARRIKEASLEVCDLSWKEKLSRHYSLKSRKRTHKSYEVGIAKACESIPYREIFIFSDERRKEKLKRRIKENIPGYSCRYFNQSSNIPRLQFVIIDREEIVFASSSYPALCSIKHKELGSIFQSYYDDVWDHAIPLKEGDRIFSDEVEKALK